MRMANAIQYAVSAAYGNSYGYDGNGNQTTRTIAGTTYTLVFDYENRLTEVKQDTTTLATFLYDADGNRVKGTVSGVTTVYVADIYEYQGGATTKYYEGGGLRRTGYSTNNGVFYMLGDHLKSTSALVARNGVPNVKYFYYPYGARRGVPFNTITAKHFTGQYHETALPGGEGLSFYNARWYDPELGSFLSADSIVPAPLAPQSLNRYAYVGGNPVNHRDPTGHACDDGPQTYAACYGNKPVSHAVMRAANTPGGRGTVTYSQVKSVNRNLTQFAVAQARAMARDRQTLSIASRNVQYARTGNPGYKASAYLSFEELVGDGKWWDLKDKMLDRLGESFMFCGMSRCYWFEYSVLGNILYGYVGMQAGFSEAELRIGAGYAEARDPENSERFNWPTVYPIAYLPEERRPYYYDDPLDYHAVSMGIEMSRRYGANVTMQAFQALVTEYHQWMARGTPNYSPVLGPGAPYGAGYFDNDGR